VAADSYAEAERLGFKAFFNLARSNRHIYRIIQECDRVDPITYRRFYAGLAETYKRANAAAAERGEIVLSDAEVLAYCMLGVGHFIAMRYLLWDDNLPEEAEDAAIAFVQRGLRP
jgi:hypothetical protein